jgi:hypothetical protein
MPKKVRDYVELLLVFIAILTMINALYCISIGLIDKLSGGFVALMSAVMLGGLLILSDTKPL